MNKPLVLHVHRASASDHIDSEPFQGSTEMVDKAAYDMTVQFIIELPCQTDSIAKGRYGLEPMKIHSDNCLRCEILKQLGVIT